MKVSLVVLLLVLVVVNADLVPSHVYLTLTGDPSQVQVTFTTTTKPTGAAVMFWGQGATTKNTVVVAAADITTFTRPVTSQVNYINSVTLTSLKNGQYYNYQVIGDTKNAATTSSQVFKFKHIPAPGQPVNIGIYGDLGAYGYALTQTSANGLKQWAQTGKFDVILHNGDLAYNLATSDGQIGDEFMKNLEPVSSSVPYVVTPGNHEFMDGGLDTLYYRNFFAGQKLLSTNSKSDTAPMWFSFDIGTAHIIGISTEVYCEDPNNIAKQWTWLEGDLRAVASRPNRPWIIVLGHRPLYSGASSYLHARLMRQGLQCTDANRTSCNHLEPCKSGQNCAYSIEALFTKYNVDMFNGGHEHIYLRNNPIDGDLSYEEHTDVNQYINPQSPVYIISGAAGTQHAPSETVAATAGATPQVKTSKDYSFSNVVVHNNTALHYYQISAEDGKLIDDFWILKNKDKPTFKTVKFALDADTQTICDQ